MMIKATVILHLKDNHMLCALGPILGYYQLNRNINLYDTYNQPYYGTVYSIFTEHNIHLESKKLK